MTTGPPPDLDALLARARTGDQGALAEILPIVYEELRRIADGYMRRERPGQTLQPTALVHEVYLRLMGHKAPDWQNRAHFLAIAATSMRQILVERARARSATKRGGGAGRLTLDEGALAAPGQAVGIEEIDEALTRLARLDPTQARIVELRFFAGLTVEEAAEAVGVSPATLKREWSVARAWLRRELAREAPGGR